MGAYIKGMEMPETCKLCYLSEFDPGFYAYVCKPTGIRIDYDMAKIDRPRTICPLVPVPTHGRLIDEKDVLTKCGYIIADGMACIPVKYIANASTVIEAEEGET